MPLMMLALNEEREEMWIKKKDHRRSLIKYSSQEYLSCVTCTGIWVFLLLYITASSTIAHTKLLQ